MTLTTEQKELMEKHGFRYESQLKEFLRYQENPITQEELERCIKREIEEQTEERLEQCNEERAKTITADMKAKMAELALKYFYDSSHFSYSPCDTLPIRRAKMAAETAFVDLFYDRPFIEEKVEKEFESALLFTTKYPFSNTKHAIIEQIEKLKKNATYVVFWESTVGWLIQDYLFEILKDKYQTDIQFEEGYKNAIDWKDQFTPIENMIFEHFERLIDHYHDGCYRMRYTDFPKQLIKDIASTVSSEGTVESSIFSFLETVLFEQCPEDKLEAEMVVEVLNHYENDYYIVYTEPFHDPTELKQIIVNLIIRFQFFKEQLEYRIPSVLLSEAEQFITSNGINLVNEETKMEIEGLFWGFVKEKVVKKTQPVTMIHLTHSTILRLGDVINIVSDYAPKGYPFVVGFVGKELILSNRRTEFDFSIIANLLHAKENVVEVGHLKCQLIRK